MINSKYSSSDLALIVPTKNRPIQICKLLTSLAGQSQKPGLTVLIDHGGEAEAICKDFIGRLEIIYINSSIAGQIYQRNLGIKIANDRYQLIGFLDDDLVLEGDAISEMVNFWNIAPHDTKGVGFNIVNCPPFKFSRLLGVLGMSSRKPGAILKTGYNVSIQNISENIRSEWLGGGYTVWSTDILNIFKQEEIKTSWAIGEDVRFSYPIGKRFKLFVCSKAMVNHEHVYDQYARNTVHFSRGKKGVVAHRYFIEQYPEDFSTLLFFWMSLGKLCLRIGYALMRISWSELMRGAGEMAGIFICFIALVKNVSVRSWLED